MWSEVSCLIGEVTGEHDVAVPVDSHPGDDLVTPAHHLGVPEVSPVRVELDDEDVRAARAACVGQRLASAELDGGRAEHTRYHNLVIRSDRDLRALIGHIAGYPLGPLPGALRVDLGDEAVGSRLRLPPDPRGMVSVRQHERVEGGVVRPESASDVGITGRIDGYRTRPVVVLAARRDRPLPLRAGQLGDEDVAGVACGGVLDRGQVERTEVHVVVKRPYDEDVARGGVHGYVRDLILPPPTCRNSG